MKTHAVRHLAVVVVAILISGSTVAGTAPPAPLFGSLAELEFMLGTWAAVESFDRGPMAKGGVGMGEMVAKTGPGGYSIVIEYRSLSGPMAGFAMHEIFAFDEQKGAFQQVYVTNRSSGMQTALGKAGENGFVFERRFDRDGQTFVSRGTIQDISDDSFAMESHLGPVNGESKRIMRLQFSRASK